MRVLYVGRYHSASLERKIELMAHAPDVDLLLVRPSRWTDVYGTKDVPVRDDASYRTLAVPMIGSCTDYHRALYRTLTFGLPRFAPDIIHVEEEPDSLAALQAGLVRRLLAPKARLVFHTWQNIDREKPWYVWAVLRASFHAADAILCAGPEAEAVLRGMGYRGRTEVVLQQTVDTTVFRPPAQPRRTDAFTVVYAGRLAPEKDLDTLIRAFERLPESTQLVIAGDGPLRSRLETRARRRGAHIRLIGSQPPEGLARVLRAADVLVLPSRTTPVWKEQFGRVLVEAMACKTAVIGSDSGAIPTVVGDAGMTFPEGDVGALARALRRLHDEPETCRTLGERGYERVRRHYTQEAIARRTLAFYGRLLAS